MFRTELTRTLDHDVNLLRWLSGEDFSDNIAQAELWILPLQDLRRGVAKCL